MANTTAGPQTSDFMRPEGDLLRHGLHELGRGGGRVYLISGGSTGLRSQSVQKLVAEARAKRIRVATLSARDRNFDGWAFTSRLIRDRRHCNEFPIRIGGNIGIEQIHSRGDILLPSEWPPSSARNQPQFVERPNWTDGFSTPNSATGPSPLVLIIEDIHEAASSFTESIATVAGDGIASGVMVVCTCPSLNRVSGRRHSALVKFARIAIHIELRESEEEGAKSPADLALQRRFDQRSIVARSSMETPPPALHVLTNPHNLAASIGPDDRVRRDKESGLSREVVLPRRSVRNALAVSALGGIGSARQTVPENNSAFSAIADSAETRARCERLIRRGEEQSHKGEIEAAEHSLREAAMIAEQLQDSALLTRIVLALPAWHWPGPGEANALAALLAQRGLVIEREDPSRRAILMSRLAAELSYAPSQRQESSEMAAAAMRQVKAGTDSWSELYIRLYRDQVLRRPEHLAERLENAEATSRLGVEAGDYAACCVASLAKVSALTALGEMGAAAHEADFAVGIMPASQVRFHHGLAAACRSQRAVMDGRLADAIEEFDRCRALAQAFKYPYLLDASWPAMLMPFAEAERLAELEEVVEDTFRRRRSALVYGALLSWLKVQIGRPADGLFLLEQLAVNQFADLAESSEGITGIAALADVCRVLDRRDFAATLYDRLSPFAELNVTLNAVASFGSVERYLGTLALVLDRLDDAIAHFERSYRCDRRSGSRPWAIYSALELVAALARRGRAEDRPQALELVSQLTSQASIVMMKRASSKLNAVRELLGSNNWNSQLIKTVPIPDAIIQNPPVSQITPAQPPPFQGQDEYGSASDPACHLDRARGAMFSRNGEYWQVGYEGQTSSFRHRRGLELISLLLLHPEREFFALELAQDGDADPRGLAIDNGCVADSGAPVLDAEAKRSYRERLTEIRDELERLRDANEIERAAKLEEEQDFLTRELASALGLFGRDRKFTSESERARKRVSIAIARAIRSIANHDAQFGHYLERSIRTGNLCCYIPDPGNPIRWTF